MRRILTGLVALIGAAGVMGWVVTAPETVDVADIPTEPGDPARGAMLFDIGGCAACHAAKGAKDEARLLLGGGQVFETAFGSFVAPNISSDRADGIGRWSMEDFVNAMLKGVSPDGAHYYPSFPYASYTRMTMRDVVDLRAYLDTIPAVSQTNPDHELGFPFNIRRAVGVWKLLYLDASPVGPAADAEAARGRYLVEALGHCAECHTPRDPLGGLNTGRWMAGAPNPDGPGVIPNITPHTDGIGGWTTEDIAYYLESGFTPEFDSVGGSMVAVVENTARLSAEDRRAIAVYLAGLPPLGKVPSTD